MSLVVFSSKTSNLKRIVVDLCALQDARTFCLKLFQSLRKPCGSGKTKITDLLKLWFCFSTIWSTCAVASLFAMAPFLAACLASKPGNRPYLTLGGLEGLLIASILSRIQKGSTKFCYFCRVAENNEGFYFRKR